MAMGSDGGRTTRVGRRRFLLTAPLSVGAVQLGLAPAASAGSAAPRQAVPHPGFPSQDPALVREVVGASHRDLDRVRALVLASPALARATWDWGFGDWETALGAASHVGRPDIAELLMAHGARADLFTHAMLGHLEVVEAAVRARPAIQSIPGPHGITLLAHARAGGERAAAVAAYLGEVGGADPQVVSLELDEPGRARYLGRYAFGAGDDDALIVELDRSSRLVVRRGADSPRILHRVEEHGFAPAGAPAVRLRFAVSDGGTTTLTVHDPEPLVVARRAGAG